MRKLLKSNIAVLVYAILGCFFFTFNVSSGSIMLFTRSNLSLARTSVFLFLFIIFHLVIRRFPKGYPAGFHILAILLSCFCSFASVMGMFYSTAPRRGAEVSFTDVITKSSGAFIKFSIVFLGGTLFFYMFLGAVGILRKYMKQHFFPEKIYKKYKSIEIPYAERFFSFLLGEKSFMKTAVFIAVCWLPHVIARYPGIVTVDSEISLHQYYGVTEYTTQHPIIYMQLLGRFADFGNWLKNVSLGLFFLILIQSVILLFVMTYMVDTMKKFHMPTWLLNITLVLIGFAPCFTGYIATFVIDILYDAFIVLFIIELVWYLFKQEIYFSSWRHPACTIAAVLGMFFRKNGIYVVAVVLLFVAGRELYMIFHKKQNVRSALLFLAFLFLPMCAGKINDSLLNKKYNAKKISTRAMLAVPMQQIGRYVLNNGDDLTDEEIASIQAVMTYTPEEYAEKYRPYNMDGIKWGFNDDATSEEMKAFFQTWFQLFMKHPDTYINATLNQNYCLFSPIKDNVKYYDSTRESLLEIEKVDFSDVYKQNNSKGFLKKLTKEYYKRFCDVPLLGLYVNQGIIDFLLLAICLYCLFDKNGRLLVVALPFLLTLAITFVGPAAHGHPRYTFPITYAMPLFFGLYLKAVNFENEKERYMKK